jgi:uncharacterized protein YkwD
VGGTIQWNSPRALIFVAAFVLALLWPKLHARIDTAAVQDNPSCPHSSDFPSANGDPAGRQEIVCLLNLERGKYGLVPLREEVHLDQAAQVQADDIATRHFFAHVNPDGRTPQDRITAAGYPSSPMTGENILWGEEREATPVRAVRAWMHSPGHRANILRPQFIEIGVGVTRGAPQTVRGRAAVYATTFGGGPLTAAPAPAAPTTAPQ